MQSGLTVVFILVISRHSICDPTLRGLTVTAKAKVCHLLFIVRRTQHCGAKLSYTTINKALLIVV